MERVPRDCRRRRTRGTPSARRPRALAPVRRGAGHRWLAGRARVVQRRRRSSLRRGARRTPYRRDVAGEPSPRTMRGAARRSWRRGRRCWCSCGGDELLVEPALSEEVFVRATLHDVTALEDDDLVRVADRAEAVRDDEAARTPPAEVRIDALLGLGVERARGFVEDD